MARLTPTHSTRAVLIDKLGPPDVFVERDVPLADPGPGEVHLRVDACGVNFADLMMRVGLYGTVPPRPFSPGFEVAGTVVRTGDAVEGYRAGDRVIGLLLRHGGYARDVVAPTSQLFPCPAALDPVGGDATAACRRLLAPLGRLVFYGMSQAMPNDRRQWIAAAKAWRRTPRIHPMQLVEPNLGVFGVHLLHLAHRQERVLTPAIAEIFRRVEQGELRPVVDSVFSLDREGAVAAHRHIHSRANLGKVVLAVDA